MVKYPANLYMWIFSVELGAGESLTELGNLVRLTLQLAGIWVSLYIANYETKKINI